MLRLHVGDCITVLQGYEESSVGAMVSDPPYDLISASGRGFMGKEWDGTGIAFSQEFWGSVYRTLKPGAQVKAFSATRTYHRMAAAMRDAGFVDLALEAWTYGSGFPKSMNIGKVIDKMDVAVARPAGAAKHWEGWGTALKPAWEPVIIGRKPE